MRFVGIDPSTKTGFVARDERGYILRAKELTGVGSQDPKRMSTMIDDIMAHIHPEDLIVIEGFGFSSPQAIQLGGIGWAIRMALFKRGIKYYEVAPNAVKKFVNVSGWTGEKVSKQRLEGKEKKKAVMAAVKEMYGFESNSDNVVDAFIMAQIASEIWMEQNVFRILPVYQAEVIQQIINPVPKTKKKGGKANGGKRKTVTK